jgi:hypothetical protein
MRERRSSFHRPPRGAILLRAKTQQMNTETAPSELASQALAQLAEALQTGKREALTTYLKVMRRFTKYSWGNCLLISMQRPDASHVASFHSWLGLGRHVRKGEKGIVILAPVVSKGKYSKDKQATLRMMPQTASQNGAWSLFGRPTCLRLSRRTVMTSLSLPPCRAIRNTIWIASRR